jgi:surface protein
MKKLALLISFLFVISCSKDPIIYTLTTSANPSDGGTVSPSTQQYEEGKTATITATPAAEYLFQSWSGATGSTNSTSVVMNSDKSVTANFIKKKYALTTTVEGEGTVTEKVIKAGLATDYNSGTIVELTAVPSGEWLFLEWKGDVTGTENPTQITIDKAKSVTAVFVKKQYPLTIEFEGEGTVAEKVIKQGVATDYNSGTVVELTASPSDEWEFKEWTGDVTGAENPIQITIDKAKTITAVFAEKSKIYLDENGITINCDDAEPGSYTNFNGKEYYIARDKDDFKLKWENGIINELDCVCTSNIENLDGIFAFISSHSGGASSSDSVKSWDTSNVTSMVGTFRDWNAGLGPPWLVDDISYWDVSKVSTMKDAFMRSRFNGDISKWDVSNVTDMSRMFYMATKFNTEISNWDVSNVTEMNAMFYQAAVFNQDLTKWCVKSWSAEPTWFSLNSALTEANKPIWGTCPSESTIWNGTTITFTKADGANPEEEANQDRITDNIWITRGNDGGQIFNIKTETSYNKTDSPVGTKWAVGTLDEIETLTFKKFRAAVEKPNSSLVGKNLVMYLEEDDVYLSVKFTSWSEQKNGGFAYERSTKP